MLSSKETDPPCLCLVKEKLTADPDSEIATTSLRVSLMCPVGLSPRPSARLSMRSRVCKVSLTVHLLLPAGEDAPDGAVPGGDLLPPAVLRRRALPADEREEAHLDLPRVRQEGRVRGPHHRRVSGLFCC